MGSHLLPIEQGPHLCLPRHKRVCRLCHTGALGDERHMLLEVSGTNFLHWLQSAQQGSTAPWDPPGAEPFAPAC